MNKVLNGNAVFKAVNIGRGEDSGEDKVGFGYDESDTYETLF